MFKLINMKGEAKYTLKKAVIRIILALFISLVLFICPLSIESAASLTSFTSFGGHCYQIHNDADITWEEASAAASAMTIVVGGITYQGHLVTITSQSENDFVEGMLNDAFAENAWIGAKQLDNQLTTGNGWQWVTGESFSYENWADQEPNDAVSTMDIEDNEENYLQIYDDGKWNDNRNDPGIDHYVVEYEVSLSLTSFGEHYYQINNDADITWEEANTAASALTVVVGGITYQGHLATITSQSENDFVDGMVNDAFAENAWIGAKQLDNQLTTGTGWQWVTGESFSYENWAGQEPNDAINTMDIEDNEENYLQIYDDGKWNDNRNDPGIDHYVVEYKPTEDPKVTTNPATDVAINSARLNGSLTTLGTYTGAEVSFKWGTTPGLYTGSTIPIQMNSTGNFTYILKNLRANTTYYFVAQAVSNRTTATGAELNFTTKLLVSNLSNPLIGTGTQNSYGINSQLKDTDAPTSHSSSSANTITITPAVLLPNIQVQSASLSASTVSPGTPITVTAIVINKGTVNGSKNIILYVNGQQEESQGANVTAGGELPVKFTIFKNNPGTYSVYVGAKSAGSIEVNEVIDPNAILYLSIGLVLISIIGLIFLSGRRQERY